MKGQCERCREIVELALSINAGVIEVTCPACKATYAVAEKSPELIAEDAEEAEKAKPPSCPKCGEARRTDAEACRRCGLVFARWSGAAAADVPVELQEAVRLAAELWALCEAAWADGARHETFIQHCQRSGAFAYAAGRYRAAQAERGAAAEPAASQALEKIRKSAEAAMMVGTKARKREADTTPYKNTVVLLIVLLALVVATMFWTIIRRAGKHEGVEERRTKPAVKQPVRTVPRTPVPREP